MTDKILLKYLKDNNIEFHEYPHIAVFTVQESKKIKEKIPGQHTKCLFLKDEKNNFYLACIPALKRLDIKNLEKHLNVKYLTFASQEELKKELNLTPGSVSLFGMIYSKNTSLIIDKELWDAEIVGFHPNINTSTITISHENLEKFLNSLKAKILILQLKNLEKHG